jgi:hypothetical protein
MWECPTEIRDIDEVIEVGEEVLTQLTPCLDEICVRDVVDVEVDFTGR